MISLKEIWKGFDEVEPIFENTLDTHFRIAKRKWSNFLTFLGYLYFWVVGLRKDKKLGLIYAKIVTYN